jgi:hypothetical protein
MMIILMVAAQVLAVGFCLFGAWRLRRRRRARALVDENWWPEFECQFRAYAARYERRADVPEHGQRHGTRGRGTRHPGTTRGGRSSARTGDPSATHAGGQHAPKAR